jgi:CRISPR-associated exonuclease Cas4
MEILLGLAVILLAAALVILWTARRQRRASGLPVGKVIYVDTDERWGKVEKPLYDARSGLTGKPDYLVEENGRLTPVEVKSGRAPNRPHDSHIYQLAAYCMLVERTYGKRPTRGILRYRDRTFSIDYTQELEQELEDILESIRLSDRQMKKGGEIDRSHNEAGRCARCGYRGICDQRL